jgi:SAM-dependent methyltransferase
MGLDRNGTQFILHAKAQGVDFSQTAMIGRQGLHLKPAQLRENLQKFGLLWDDEAVARVFSENGGYAEAFLKRLGAEEVHSFDNSSYEGATHVHDMNQPVPDAWKGQYSVVLDSGSLEHVFNFPVAIRNCMEMLRPGGHYLGLTPANNFMGHGFYQFSPELHFRIFAPENGFEMMEVILLEDRPHAPWYAVSDPAAVGRRVNLINTRPAYLFLISKRVALKPIFEQFPQQSDYATAWEAAKSGHKKERLSWQRWLLSKTWVRLPQRARDAIKGLFWSGRDPRYFHRIDPTQNQRASENG